MIHEILPSDVEFARGMLDSARSDAEILSFLASRGIEPAKAAELLDDLRHGRTPDVPVAFMLGQRHEPADAVRSPLPAAQPHRAHGRKHRHRSFPWWFVLLLGIFLLALGYAFFEAGSGVVGERLDQDKHEIPPPPHK
jgi:hypothetical protein